MIVIFIWEKKLNVSICSVPFYERKLDFFSPFFLGALTYCLPPVYPALKRYNTTGRTCDLTLDSAPT